MGLLAFIAYCYLIAPGHEYDIALYPLLLASFAGIVVFAAGFETRSEGRLIRTIRFSANYSFTLYLIHYTILYAFSRIGLTGWGGFFGGVITANLIAIAMAIPTEMRHRAFARWMSALFERKSLWPG
jgi:peptidoglycan/LPS O-acetylase OafA/YrhL